jgi:hypothetical protein
MEWFLVKRTIQKDTLSESRSKRIIASFYGNQFPKSWMEGHEEFIKQLDWPIGYDTLFARGEGDQPIGMAAVGK